MSTQLTLPRLISIGIATWAFALPLAAQDAPQAEISNGLIEATLYLPDPENGYYRGTRFEWAGVFGRLEFRGRNYAARWYEPHDPRRHDSLGGPIQEFVIDGRDNAGIGFGTAQVGGTFVKIGVGVLRKPDDRGYRFSQYYEIVDPGNWTVDRRPDAVTFTHALADPPSGYAYRYTKVVRLVEGEPSMVLAHTLLNRGTRPIETSVYNHNFLVMSDQPSGPALTIRFPFDLRVTQTGPAPLLDITRDRMTYRRSLEPGESVRYELDGFGASPSDNDLTVEDSATGIGIRISGDRPLSHFVYWSVPTVISPETYIRIRIDPGQEFSWQTRYTFHELP
jgi:hypothetical protein